jgi:hypothetical protein
VGRLGRLLLAPGRLLRLRLLWVLRLRVLWLLRLWVLWVLWLLRVLRLLRVLWLRILRVLRLCRVLGRRRLLVLVRSRGALLWSAGSWLLL